MTFSGIQKFTLLDYPGKIAATLFSPGCNFRCPFCHNSEIVNEKPTSGTISEEDVLAFLKTRQGLLEGVCITGGEPTLQKGLQDFIIKVRDLGFLVKLDTNGNEPKVLEVLLSENLLSYVAMDVKNSLLSYGKTVGITAFDTSKIEQSIEILKKSNIPYEFRTTVVKELHRDDDLRSMAEWLLPCTLWRLQEFRDSPTCLKRGLHSLNKNDIKLILNSFIGEKCVKIYE